MRASATATNIHARNDFANARVQFERKGTGHVAFIGGSITEMNGYRPMVCRNLQKRFPKTKFTFTSAGISSTCSTTGAFRLTRDVLSKGPVDLFFVEFAVNDDQDAAHARRDCIRGIEGIIRQCRRHNPNMDIVITYFANPGIVATIQKDKTPLAAGSHEEVAKHYGVSTIDLAREVAQQITAGTLTWKKYGGTHPAPYGNAICANMIESLLAAAWKDPLAKEAKQTPHPVPETTVDANHYGDGRSIDPSRAKVVSGWKLHVPQWKKIPGGFRGRFANTPLMCATKPGAELTLEFSGKAIGAYVLAGPSAGTLLASIDGGDFKPVDLFHRHSRGLHYPRTVMFDADLKPGKHVLTLKVAEKKNAQSKGTAARILQFVAN
jgi:lysophospholipase L1-like esterase